MPHRLPSFVCSYCYDDFVPSRKQYEQLKADIIAGKDPVAFCSPECQGYYSETRSKDKPSASGTAYPGIDKRGGP